MTDTFDFNLCPEVPDAPGWRRAFYNNDEVAVSKTPYLAEDQLFAAKANGSFTTVLVRHLRVPPPEPKTIWAINSRGSSGKFFYEEAEARGYAKTQNTYEPVPYVRRQA